MMASHSFSASPPVAPSTSSCPSPVHVYVAGVGDVGAALLRQIDARGDAGRDLRVIGACTSRRAAWGAPNRDPEAPLAGVDEAAPPDWPAIVDRLAQETPRPLVFVDATGSPDVADYYEPLLRAGVHVVTPSKLANTRSQAAFDRLREAAAEAGVQYRYETTVGAGLPVVQTVRNLVATGDRVRSIRGVVSGTLTFLFSALRDGSSFSEAVRAAVDRGYAEPDVRDDLSGTDVARKFLILARTAGYAVEPTEVQVESLVPDSLADAPYEAFLDRLSTVHPYWRERSAAAAAESAVLQYVGRFSPEGIEVGVEPVPGDTALGQLGAQENLFEVTTDRYAAVPLVVRGPGAGPSVTAAGVLADVLTAVREARPPSPPA
ncbi:bifunctional aspartokinase/homoserine [Salinibacter ruber M8]|uniref:Homoserine dehydrogenase n=2 Tax=Salinibacter ruber TaxID=146919 RepID=D5H628_SALRM|nr:bifunctional aspartokinase/homoserine [Salinibacter ruber M8]